MRLKPTYGRLSRAGSFPFVDSFDHLGPLARSAEDLALSFDAMQGWDPEDPVCTDRPNDATLSTLVEGIGGLRIAVAGDYFERSAEPEALEAAARDRRLFADHGPSIMAAWDEFRRRAG